MFRLTWYCAAAEHWLNTDRRVTCCARGWSQLPLITSSTPSTTTFVSATTLPQFPTRHIFCHLDPFSSFVHFIKRSLKASRESAAHLFSRTSIVCHFPPVLSQTTEHHHQHSHCMLLCMKVIWCRDCFCFAQLLTMTIWNLIVLFYTLLHCRVPATRN